MLLTLGEVLLIGIVMNVKETLITSGTWGIGFHGVGATRGGGDPGVTRGMMGGGEGSSIGAMTLTPETTILSGSGEGGGKTNPVIGGQVLTKEDEALGVGVDSKGQAGDEEHVGGGIEDRVIDKGQGLLLTGGEEETTEDEEEGGEEFEGDEGSDLRGNPSTPIDDDLDETKDGGETNGLAKEAMDHGANHAMLSVGGHGDTGEEDDDGGDGGTKGGTMMGKKDGGNATDEPEDPHGGMLDVIVEPRGAPPMLG